MNQSLSLLDAVNKSCCHEMLHGEILAELFSIQEIDPSIKFYLVNYAGMDYNIVLNKKFEHDKVGVISLLIKIPKFYPNVNPEIFMEASEKFERNPKAEYLSADMVLSLSGEVNQSIKNILDEIRSLINIICPFDVNKEKFPGNPICRHNLANFNVIAVKCNSDGDKSENVISSRKQVEETFLNDIYAQLSDKLQIKSQFNVDCTNKLNRLKYSLEVEQNHIMSQIPMIKAELIELNELIQITSFQNEFLEEDLESDKPEITHDVVDRKDIVSLYSELQYLKELQGVFKKKAGKHDIGIDELTGKLRQSFKREFLLNFELAKKINNNVI